MDSGDAFSASVFKWDPRGLAVAAPPPPPPSRPMQPPQAPAAAEEQRQGPRELGEVFAGYGVRYATVARLGELGFTASTLVGMTEGEVEEVLSALAHLFRWDLLLGERYGVKAALRAERHRLLDHHHATLFLHHDHHHQHTAVATGDDARRRMLPFNSSDHHHPAGALDALSQGGLSEEPVQQQDWEAAASGGEGNNDGRTSQQRRSTKKSKAKKLEMKKRPSSLSSSSEEKEEDGWGTGSEGSERSVAGRQREHPFIVTEPGEVARAKKNGLDYLFHLFEQCRHFLLQVQALAKERGDKCPTKVSGSSTSVYWALLSMLSFISAGW